MFVAQDTNRTICALNDSMPKYYTDKSKKQTITDDLVVQVDYRGIWHVNCHLKDYNGKQEQNDQFQIEKNDIINGNFIYPDKSSSSIFLHQMLGKIF